MMNKDMERALKNYIVCVPRKALFRLGYDPNKPPLLLRPEELQRVGIKHPNPKENKHNITTKTHRRKT